MKTKILISVALFFVGLTIIQAQSRATKETKVVLVVNEKTNFVTNIATHASFGVEREMKKKYPNSKFFIGILNGNYEVTRKGISPIIGATVTIYTNRQLFTEDKMGNFNRMGNFKKGDVIKLGSSYGKVISKLQVEMQLRVL